MRLRKRLGAVLGAALLTTGLTILSPLLTSPASAAEVLVDGGFEAAVGDPPVSPGWSATDSEVDTPVCTPGYCTIPPAGVGPHTGGNYLWFGGTPIAGHTSSVSQTVTLPNGSANLAFWLAIPEQTNSGTPARLDVTVDGKRVDEIAEFDLGTTPAYQQIPVDISEFADGGSHVLGFDYVNGDAGEASFVVDDITLDAVAGSVIGANASSLGAIPDAPDCDDYVGGGPRDVTFTVAGTVGRATSVGVRMAFEPEHTYAGDVVATLIAPDGRRVTIFGALDQGDDSNDLVGPYLFSDGAAESPTIESASLDSEDGIVPAGHYRAFQNGDDLITPAFASMNNVNGTWTLRLKDLCGEDTGSVSAAALYLTTDGVAVDTDGDGVADVTDDCPAKAGVKPGGCPDTKAPDTDFLNAPAKGVAKSLKVPFGFVSDETGVSYLCSLDGKAFAACTNPTTVTVKSGRHTFEVAARDVAGNVDPYPATSTFTAYDCHSLKHKVRKLTKALKAVKKSVKATEAKLKKAEAAGDQVTVGKLEKKLTKLEKQQKKTAKKLAKAKTKVKPCKVAGTSAR